MTSAAIIGVDTAVPAFIGYTEKAGLNGKPCRLQPIGIASLADYEAVFGGADRYLHTLTPVPPGAPGGIMIGAACFRPDIVQRHDLFDSLRLFYANGGASCTVVSVGSYQDTPSQEALTAGLAALRDLAGPTMLVIPEAVRLPFDAYAAVVHAMLAQCNDRQDRVAILDVPAPGDAVPDSVAAFRAVIGSVPQQMRGFGIAYYPFVQTLSVDAGTLGYGSLAPSARETLQGALLQAAGEPSAALRALIGQITQVGPDDPDYPALNKKLTAKFPALRALAAAMAAIENVLPPSPAMAGVYTSTDATRGVWTAPANVALGAVTGATVKITDKMQQGLNAPLDGMAVNAIRDFTGRGTLVWGARTLDANSDDSRYVQVRRTLIYIEQSIRRALATSASEPNAPPAWAAAIATTSSFLHGIWMQGGLAGDKDADSFSVACGLGSTMTADDILNGRMIVQIQLALLRPAEFIALTVAQQMQGG